jgi:hypothetical protein
MMIVLLPAGLLALSPLIHPKADQHLDGKCRFRMYCTGHPWGPSCKSWQESLPGCNDFLNNTVY